MHEITWDTPKVLYDEWKKSPDTFDKKKAESALYKWGGNEIDAKKYLRIDPDLVLPITALGWAKLIFRVTIPMQILIIVLLAYPAATIISAMLLVPIQVVVLERTIKTMVDASLIIIAVHLLEEISEG